VSAATFLDGTCRSDILFSLGRLARAGVVALLIGLLVPSGVRAESSWPRVPTDAEIQSAADSVIAGWPTYHGQTWMTSTYKVQLDRPGVDESKVPPLYRAGVLLVAYEVPLVVDCGSNGGIAGKCNSAFQADLLGYEGGQWTFSNTNFDSDAQTDTLDSFVPKALSFLHYDLGWPDLTGIASPAASSGVTAEPTLGSGLPLCAATIHVPAGLKAGDTLSPSADVTSEDGKPTQGTIAEVWTIGGVQANSVTWDGKPAQILLQLSCQGHAQEFHATYAGGVLSQGSNGPSGDNGGPPIWLVAAAGAAALAAAAAAILRMRSKSPRAATPQSQTPQSQPGPAGYILQASAQVVEVGPGDFKTVEFRVWRVDPQGGVTPAPEASIDVIITGDAPGLSVSPRSGSGLVASAISITGPAKPGEVQLVARAATADGGAQTAVVVRVVVHPVIELALSDPGARLRPGGDPVRAYARVLSDPTDPTSADPIATGQIQFTIEGSNASSVAPSAPTPQDGYQWVQLSCAASADTGLATGNPTLVARVVANGQPLRATVALAIERDVQLAAYVNGAHRAPMPFDAASGGWDIVPISAFFHQASNDQPAPPPTSDWTSKLQVTADPPVVELTGVGERAPNQFELGMRLVAGVDLETFFGKQLADRDGVFSVGLAVTDPASGGSWSASVEYQLRPRLELFAQGWPDPDHRFWASATLAGTEFVTDADDRLSVAIGCCRADKPKPRIAGQTGVVPIDWWTLDSSVDASGGVLATADLDVRDEKDDGDLRVRSVGTVRPMIRPDGGTAGNVTIKLSATLGAGIPANYLPVAPTLDLAVRPHLLDLRTWVVPGRQRASSELWAFLFLADRPDIPVPDTLLAIETTSGSTGGPTLGAPDGGNRAAGETAADGTVSIPLWYRGLNWSNWEQGVFTVGCRVTAKAGAQLTSDLVSTVVDVAENIRNLLGELVDKNEMLHLNNPFFDPALRSRLGKAEAEILDELTGPGWRPEFSGPAWNFLELASGQESASGSGDKRLAGKAKFARDYVCSEYRDRIARWLVDRRNYQRGRVDLPATVTRMNGIEFDNYFLGGDAGALHNFEALFLAGMDPDNDPRAVDPWWKQEWKDSAYRTPDGLITSKWEDTYAAEFGAWAAASMIRGGGEAGVALAIVWAGGVLYAALAGVSVNPDSVYSAANGYAFSHNGAFSLPYFGVDAFVKDWVAANPNG